MTSQRLEPADTRAYLNRVEALPISGAHLSQLMEDVLAAGLAFRFQAGGSSMSPFIRDGDVVSIEALVDRAPRTGDVLAYRQMKAGNPGLARLVLHRVIKTTTGGCIFLGDNQPAGESDGPVAREHVLGAVTRIERGGRSIRLGLGPECWVIAMLSRLGLLRPATHFAAMLRRRMRKFFLPDLQHRKPA